MKSAQPPAVVQRHPATTPSPSRGTYLYSLPARRSPPLHRVTRDHSPCATLATASKSPAAMPWTPSDSRSIDLYWHLQNRKRRGAELDGGGGAASVPAHSSYALEPGRPLPTHHGWLLVLIILVCHILPEPRPLQHSALRQPSRLDLDSYVWRFWRLCRLRTQLARFSADFTRPFRPWPSRI